MNETELDDFHNSYDVDENGCWIWNGVFVPHPTHPYPRAHIETLNGSYMYAMSAHRLSLMHFKNEKLERFDFACHTCHNTKCVNPDHLYKGTPETNMKDMVKAGNYKKDYGMRSKLTADDVREIRREWRPDTGDTVRLACKYGVGKSCIYAVVYRYTWKWVD